MSMKDDSLFFCSIEKNDKNKDFIEKLEQYSEDNSKQVYIISKALGTTNDYDYDISEIAIVLIPKHKITIINYGDNEQDDLEDFLYDLKEDLGHISDKYEYSKILGRVRKWKDEELFEIINVNDFEIDSFISSEVSANNIRKIDLLISLLIGSINDINKIGTTDPISLLEKVKRKIILFDGRQSNFIYGKTDKKRVTIQGLAGTGKTELLLNKLKEVYTNADNPIIAFTCFNKVLASELKKKRIPQFFNFMKVSEQIEWDSRLHVFSSWGRKFDPESGLISFISSKYNTTYKTYSECKDFESLCKSIKEELNEQESFSPCFDYLFVDESQDFGEEFLLLCEKITRKKVYVAGDIFQNIFDSVSDRKDIKIDFLLNKCYRTDPKTLMFAHSVGMGLYESPKINWLEDDNWEKCGYTLERKDEGIIRLSRKPLRRFEDLEVAQTIKLISSDKENIVDSTIDQIKDIQLNNPDVDAEDIAIIILDSNYNRMCNLSMEILYKIEDEFNWECTRGYLTKETEQNKLFISNINNIKGLEFPFIICISPNNITKNIFSRNGIYTSLTRSFLTSYFIVNSNNEEFLTTYGQALNQIYTGYMDVTEPSEDERIWITTNIQNAKRERMPLQSIIDIVAADYVSKGLEISIIQTNAERLYKRYTNDSEVIERLKNICEQMI